MDELLSLPSDVLSYGCHPSKVDPPVTASRCYVPWVPTHGCAPSTGHPCRCTSYETLSVVIEVMPRVLPYGGSTLRHQPLAKPVAVLLLMERYAPLLARHSPSLLRECPAVAMRA